MSDVFSVTTSWTNTGGTVVGTVAGTNTHTTDPSTVVETWDPFDVGLTAVPSGATSVAHFAATQVTRTIPGATTVEDVLIDAPAGSTLAAANGKVYTVSADRKSISAVV